MFWRAIIAFLALPGVVAFAIPLAIGLSQPHLRVLRPLGWPILLTGVSILVWCVKEFYVAGKGTLAPWAPPKRLVSTGPYRLSRNPMYVGVALILISWAVLYSFLILAAYAAIVLLAFHIRVIVGEEPWLARTFGADWESYRRRVPRWLF